MLIQELIADLSKDPFNPELNFNCAVEYEKLNQSASAVSFYLRAMEYGYKTHQTLVYTSLLKLAKCFDDQNDRIHTVTNCLLQAIAYDESRPEAYFLLARFHERQANWQECYTWSVLGSFFVFDYEYLEPLPVDVEYYGDYCLTFERAVSAYWVGRKDESIKLFTSLGKLDIRPEYKKSIEDNLSRLVL